MNSFVLLIFFVLRHLQISINAIDSSSRLGLSPCMYSGSFDATGVSCSVVPMSVEILPPMCSSFIYDGLIYYDSSEFYPSESDIPNMNALRSSGKELYLYYSHGSLQDWIQTTSDTDAVNTEAAKLSSFLRHNAVSGLILQDLNYDYNGNLDYNVDPYFSNYLRDYVTVMKQKIPNLMIGLYVNASNMIFYSSNPQSSDWFDFAVLNDVMDFYVIGFDKFNPCNEHFSGGIVPINNICGFNNSLTRLATAFDASVIAKDNIYLEFSANPTPNNPDYLLECAVTYQQICQDISKKNTWCADNPDSLFKKGVFAKQIQAKGIITKYIDTIDPNGACVCDPENKFITFDMILRGFLGQVSIPKCTNLDSIAAEEPSCLDDSTPSKNLLDIHLEYLKMLYNSWFSQ